MNSIPSSLHSEVSYNSNSIISFIGLCILEDMSSISRKEKCKRWDSNPRVRTHYDLNVAPWTTRSRLLL